MTSEVDVEVESDMAMVAAGSATTLRTSRGRSCDVSTGVAKQERSLRRRAGSEERRVASKESWLKRCPYKMRGDSPEGGTGEQWKGLWDFVIGWMGRPRIDAAEADP